MQMTKDSVCTTFCEKKNKKEGDQLPVSWTMEIVTRHVLLAEMNTLVINMLRFLCILCFEHTGD